MTSKYCINLIRETKQFRLIGGKNNVEIVKDSLESMVKYIEDNQLLEINVRNSRCTKDTNLNPYVNKKRSAGKVDLVMATLDAVYLVNENEILCPASDFGVQT